MLGLIIGILIVYGLTLILVQGKIFEPLKIKLALFIDSLDAKLNGSDEYIAELISQRKLDTYQLVNWDATIKNLEEANSNDPEEFKIFQDANKQMFEIIRKDIISKNKKLKTLYIFLYKVQELLQCMMCTGFWVGVILCVATLGGGISIVGIPLHIVTASGYNVLPTIFFMACLFSGTTWAIHCLVDLLYELKEGLSDLIKRG
jgi:hypothetical protein